MKRIVFVAMSCFALTLPGMNQDEEYPAENALHSCDYYRSILLARPGSHSQLIGGNLNVGFSSDGNLLLVPTPFDKIEGYDKYICELLRAKFACDEGFLVSPLSEGNTIRYVERENFQDHVEKARKQQKQTPNRENCTIQ